MSTALVGLGSNVGDRLLHLRNAVRAMAALDGVEVVAVSPVYETDPVGRVQQAPFLNAAVKLRTTLPPAVLLERLHAVENAEGRRRDVRWGPRTLDLDLLLYDQIVLSGEGLTLPHPLMSTRGFVLEPLAEIAPDAHDPVTGLDVRALCDRWRGANANHARAVGRVKETI